MKRRVISSLLSLAFISACSDNLKSDKVIINSVIKSLENSTTLITQHTEKTYEILKSKLTDIQYHEVATRWEPRAKVVKQITSNLSIYISDLKKLALEKKTLDKEKLQSLLNQFKNVVLNVDPDIKQWLNTRGSLLDDFDSTYVKSKLISKELLLLTLTKIQNNISIIESECVAYCNIRANFIHDDFSYRFSFLLNQNTKHLNSGEELIVSAGIGSFSDASKPTISINGTKLSLDENAVATYKIQVKGDTGKYSLPVKVKYTDADGTEKSGIFYVDYYVDK